MALGVSEFLTAMRKSDQVGVYNALRMNPSTDNTTFFAAAVLSREIPDKMLRWFLKAERGVNVRLTRTSGENFLHQLISHPFPKFNRMKSRLKLLLDIGVDPREVAGDRIKVNPCTKMIGQFVTSVVKSSKLEWPFDDSQTAELVHVFGRVQPKSFGMSLKILFGCYMNGVYRGKITNLLGTGACYFTFPLSGIQYTLKAIAHYCSPAYVIADKSKKLVIDYVKEWWDEWEKEQNPSDAIKQYIADYFENPELIVKKTIWDCIDKFPRIGDIQIGIIAKEHINDRNDAGQTPLEYILSLPPEKFHYELVFTFLQYMNPNARTHDGDTLFSKYLQRIITSTSKMFALNMFNPHWYDVEQPKLSLPGRGGLTPLHYLALLLDSGEEWDKIIAWYDLTPEDFVIDGKGRNPVDYALESGRVDIKKGIEFLQNWGVESSMDECFFIEYWRE